jgi:hypothetical protein
MLVRLYHGKHRYSMRMIGFARCTYEFAAQTTFRNVVQIGAVIQDPGIAF